MNYREALDLATKAVLQLKNHTMAVYLDRAVQQWIQIIRASDPAGLKDLIDPTSPPPVH